MSHESPEVFDKCVNALGDIIDSHLSESSDFRNAAEGIKKVFDPDDDVMLEALCGRWNDMCSENPEFERFDGPVTEGAIRAHLTSGGPAAVRAFLRYLLDTARQ